MMTTNTLPDYIIDQARASDLVRLAERYGVTLRRESASSWCGPCPVCGGTDRFWIRDNRYKCRDNNGGCGISGDPIAFVMLRERCEFIEAVSMLTGYQAEGRIEHKTLPRRIEVPPAPPAPKRQPPNDAWIAKVTQAANDANRTLFTDAHAEPGREYLLGRGIEPHAWERFHLGYRADVPLPGTWDDKKKAYMLPGKPAIVMPWYRQGKITAIRYRFLERHEYTNAEGKPAGAKQTAQPGSYFTDSIYGAHVLPAYTWLPVEHSEGKRIEALRTLVVCEGEINAISIWQVTHDWGWEVLSLGSESAHVPQTVIDRLAMHFGRILIWMDRSGRAREEMARIGPLAWGVNSLPILDENGKQVIGDDGKPRQKDANDLLRDGDLGEFLARVRIAACRSSEERQRFYFDLWDADQLPGGLDVGARQVMSDATPAQWAEVGERVRG